MQRLVPLPEICPWPETKMGASSKLDPEVSYCGAARGRMCGAAGRRWGRVWGDCDMWARLLTLLGLRVHAAATGAVKFRLQEGSGK